MATFVVTIADGKSTYEEDTEAAARVLMEDESVTRISMGVGSQVDDDEMELLSSRSDLDMRVNNYDDLLLHAPVLSKAICQGESFCSAKSKGRIC